MTTRFIRQKKNNQRACPAKLVTRKTSVKWVKRSGGFLVLTMVLIVCAVVLAVGSGIFLRSISEMNEGADAENSLKAWGTVNACGEYALLQLASTTEAGDGWDYAGDESLAIPLPDGTQTCYIYTVETSGTAKLIKASSTVSSFTKKILIEVATNTPSIKVNLWTEVADF